MKPFALFPIPLLLFMLALAACEKPVARVTSKAELEALRTDLKERVANGDLTQPEAVVAIANAQKQIKRAEGKKKKEQSPELKALGSELKEKMASGEISEKEAAEQWMKAARKKSPKKKAQDSNSLTEK